MKSMIRDVLFTFVLVLTTASLHAQTSIDHRYLSQPVASGKPALDFAALDNWAWVPPGVIVSDDGRFFVYKVATRSGFQSAIVQSTGNSWRYEYGSGQPGLFSGDSRWYVYMVKDSLFFLSLGKGLARQAGPVTGYQTNRKRPSDKIVWIAFQLKDSAGTVVLHHFQSGREQQIAGVKSYEFDSSGRWLLCRLKNGELLLHPLADGRALRLAGVTQYLPDKSGQTLFCITQTSGLQSVQQVNLAAGRQTSLWEGRGPDLSAGALAADEAGRQLLFTVQEKKGRETATAIWYWRAGMDKAIERVRDGSPGIDRSLCIAGSASFTGNDRYIRFNLKHKWTDTRKAGKDAVAVDVWHYRDTLIQSLQLLYGRSSPKKSWLEPKSYAALMRVEGSSEIFQLGEEYKKLSGDRVSDYAVIRRDGMLDLEELDNFARKDSVWLVSLRDGARSFFRLEYLRNPINSSSTDRYLFWFDRDRGHYFTYDLQEKREINISAAVPVYLGSDRTFDTGTIGTKYENIHTGVI
ncbi:MAG: hypothetical protein QM594_09795, partial [Niabella sp.]